MHVCVDVAAFALSYTWSLLAATAVSTLTDAGYTVSTLPSLSTYTGRQSSVLSLPLLQV